MNAIAILSLLHEQPGDGSTTRRFRGEAVLRWTMRRLALSTRIERIVVLAWDDQLDAVADLEMIARACGARTPSPVMQSIAAAQRWADGWRGGLLQTCWFDNGFDAALVRDALSDEQADAAVLVDPAAGLVDAAIIDDLVAAAESGTRDFYFTPAAPGLGGVLLRRKLVDALAAGRATPGKLVHYLPDAPVLDPITSDACVDVPLDISRVAERFTLDSDRQITRMEQATQPLNGTLISSRAAAVVRRVAAAQSPATMPRDVVLELTTRRPSQPVFGFASHIAVERPDLSAEHFGAFLNDIAGCDDLRVTLAGVGDPLLHPYATDFIAKLRGRASVAIETDLIDGDAETFRRLVAAGVDVVAVHLPATTPATYAAVMGVDAMTRVVESIRTLLEARARLGSGTPVVAPLFTKVTANFEEMEAWYDTWLRAIGSAVIVGPSTFGGRIASGGVADMTPPVRRSCERVRSRMTILSDGSIVACEQDPLGQLRLGRLGVDRIADVWQNAFTDLRERHGRLAQLPGLCTRCTEWHRP